MGTKGKDCKDAVTQTERQDPVLCGHEEQVVRGEGRGKADAEASVLGLRNAGPAKRMRDVGEKPGGRVGAPPRPSGV